MSRCMTTNTDWQGEMTKVFHTLQRIGETQLTAGCSMHVHVSPSREGNGYKPEQLHSIMKAVAYFDRAVTAAVPKYRYLNCCCKLNSNILAWLAMGRPSLLFHHLPDAFFESSNRASIWEDLCAMVRLYPSSLAHLS